MKKYLLTILLISIGFGQQNQDKELPFVNKSSIKSPKLYCTECSLSMRKTITRYVCRENHMSVKKSNVKIDKNGKLYIANSGNNEDEYDRDDYLFLAGNNLHQYVFETVVASTFMLVGNSMVIMSTIDDESPSMGYAVSFIGGFYYIKGFMKINSAGTNLKKASGKSGDK